MYHVLTANTSTFPEVIHLLTNTPTFFVLLIYFRSDLLSILPTQTKTSHLFSNTKNELFNIIRLLTQGIVVSTITAVIFVLSKKIGTKTFIPTNPYLIVLALITSALMLLSLKILEKKDASKKKFHLEWNQTIMLGLVQSMSIIPGLSRLAITYAACRWFGNDGPSSLRFSFFLHSLLSMGLILKILLSNEYFEIQQTTTHLVTPCFMGTILLGGAISYLLLKLTDKASQSYKMWMFALYYPIPIILTILLSNL